MPDADSKLPHRVEVSDRVFQVAADGRVSYLAADGKAGWRGLGFAAVIGGRACPARLSGVPARDPAGRVDLTFKYPPHALIEQVRICVLDDPPAMTVERVFVNDGDADLEIHEVRTVLTGRQAGVLFGGAAAGALRLLHVSNLRESHRFVGGATGPFVGPLPDYSRLVGDSEGHPFPALAIADTALRNFLLEGALQQDVFTQMWRIRGRYDASRRASVLSQYAGIARDGRRQPVVLRPGGRRRLSSLFYQIKTDRPLAELYDDYLAVLNRQYDLRGKGSSLLTEALYCTWNYGFCHDISEQILRSQCEFISRNLPGVRHFLIDDGYQLPENKPTYDMGKFYPDPAVNVDPVKFPSGMKAVADMIRSYGLRPALWWSPAMGRDNELVRRHPEWLALDERGGSWSMDPGPARKGALDFSVAPAREFVRQVLETLFVEWTFEGMKLDFCTYPFDLKDIRLRGGEGVHWWNWLLQTIAEFIPPGGIFQLCGSAPYGNPFIGRYCDNHRVGGDIGKGDWRTHHHVSRAPLPLLAVPGRATLLMDVDSAGVNHDLTDDENLSRLSFCYITQGVMGIGGDLTKLSPRQLGWLQRITERPDRGHKVHCPDRRAFLAADAAALPEALYVDYPPDSPTARGGVRKELAMFNWHDDARTIGYSLSALGIREGETILDFWTDQPVRAEGDQLAFRLNRRASRLLQVRPD